MNALSTRAESCTIGHFVAEREEAQGDVSDHDADSGIPRNDDREASVRALIAARRAGDRVTYFRKVVRLVIQVAETLQYVHDRGVVHRDIKPGNLLMDVHEDVWITDFGLSLLIAEASFASAEARDGTLRYMAPEQVRSDSAVVDPRCDIFSLGATLYELLTLTPVVQGSHRQEILMGILDDELTPPRNIDDLISPDLEAIVMRALAKDANLRYQTAQALAADLRWFLKDDQIRSRPPE